MIAYFESINMPSLILAENGLNQLPKINFGDDKQMEGSFNELNNILTRLCENTKIETKANQ